MSTLSQLATRLSSAETTSVELVQQALSAATDPDGEGERSFTRVFDVEAGAAARASDSRRAAGTSLSPLDGVPLAIKDLFDVQGLTTLAGSKLRLGDPVATADAPVIARLRAAGAVLVGSTNMSEFALGTLGTNRHWGTPRNPWDRATGRVPGGSSSGCAVAVSDGMAAAAVGSDTAGSVRVPAALCGLTGFKPTARRVPLTGVFPLSHSLDSVGPLARSVACCATLDAALAGEPLNALPLRSLAGAHLAVLHSAELPDPDGTVAAAFERALSLLSGSGARIARLALPPLSVLPELLEHGGISLAEALELHREPLARFADRFDPLVAKRLARAQAITPARYQQLLALRAWLQQQVAPLTAPFDAVLWPTCSRVAPSLAEVEDEARWIEVNSAYVRDNILANLLDRCALTLPVGAPDGAPVGLTFMGAHLADRELLALGAAAERVLAARCDEPEDR